MAANRKILWTNMLISLSADRLPRLVEIIREDGKILEHLCEVYL